MHTKYCGMWRKIFGITLKISILLVYVVIVAGAVVRMTGSGMGCPDWPKCFGYNIPPTQRAQLDWKSNHSYKKGQKIIKEEALFRARKDFTSSDNYAPQNWEKYTKHDYAIFNPVHTWIEYINRLATVLFGFPLLLMFVMSFFKWKTDKRYFLLTLALLASVLFEAVLGKIVVDTNLQPVRVTLHVLFVYFIVAFLLALHYIFYAPRVEKTYTDRLKKIALIAFLLTFVQVFFGTQLRQYIDVQMLNYAHESSEKWLQTPPIIFYVHRSFSILVVLINAAWIYYHRKLIGSGKLINAVAILLVLEVTTGIVLYYLDFPFLSQPIHLLLSSLLFGVQFYVLLKHVPFFRSKNISPSKI